MSKIANAIIIGWEVFSDAKEKYSILVNGMLNRGYNVNDAIAAAQQYGRMCASAQINKDILGDDSLLVELDKFNAKLYRSDYESSQ